ncbi:MAG TPA: hypothetical protein VF604_06525 [Pyrinomonadaceae bacterium]
MEIAIVLMTKAAFATEITIFIMAIVIFELVTAIFELAITIFILAIPISKAETPAVSERAKL